MNCNRRVVVKNPPTQGSSRCVCLTIHTDKYYFWMVHHSKPSRVHSTAQRCQTIIAMTPFYQPRTVTMHQQLRLVLSKTGGLAMRQTVHIVRSPVKSCGGPCVCADEVLQPHQTQYTQHDTMRIQINHTASKNCPVNPYVRVHTLYEHTSHHWFRGGPLEIQ